MLGYISLVFTSFVSSPHHMGHAMGPGMGIGMGMGEKEILNENYTFSNETLYESNTTLTPDSDSTDNTDFSLPMGIGASLGIIGLIITLLNLRENKQKNDSNETEEDIYIEPVTDGSHEVSIVNIEYETISDTLYELANWLLVIVYLPGLSDYT